MISPSTINHKKSNFFRRTPCLVSICLIMGVIGGYLVTIGQAINLSFDSFSPSFASRFAPLQFVGGGNRYAGGIFITNTEQLISPQTIIFANQSLICQKKLDGYYMSTARGLRLRPLGQNSLSNLRGADSSYNNLTVEGGLYTACIGHPQDIVGYIKHNSDYFPGGSAYIIAGATINNTNNSFSNSYEAGSFTADNFRYLSGAIYDTVVGIGIIAGTGDGQIENLFFNGLAVLGRVGLTRTINETERTALQGNTGIGSTIYGGQDITSSTTFNTINKNINTLCRGSNVVTSLQNIPTGQKVVCIDPGVNGLVTLDDPSLVAGKDIVVKQGNVFINKDMSGIPLRIFVMKGNLIMDSSITINDLQEFNKEGFRQDIGTGITQGLYREGIYMVNGLILGSADGGNTFTSINAKTFLHGKLASLNLPTSTPSVQRQLQVTSLFGTTDYNNFINLQNVFTRQCNPLTGRGVGATGSVAASIDCDNSGDLFAQNSLIVIEKNVSSVLLKQ